MDNLPLAAFVVMFILFIALVPMPMWATYVALAIGAGIMYILVKP